MASSSGTAAGSVAPRCTTPNVLSLASTAATCWCTKSARVMPAGTAMSVGRWSSTFAARSPSCQVAQLCWASATPARMAAVQSSSPSAATPATGAATCTAAASATRPTVSASLG